MAATAASEPDTASLHMRIIEAKLCPALPALNNHNVCPYCLRHGAFKNCMMNF
jgi:hypothetical protein